MPRGVKLVLRYRTPEDLTRRLIIPNLTQPESEYKNLGLVEEFTGGFLDLWIVSEIFRSPAIPQIYSGYAVLPRPLKLLEDGRHIDHTVTDSLNVGSALAP